MASNDLGISLPSVNNAQPEQARQPGMVVNCPELNSTAVPLESSPSGKAGQAKTQDQAVLSNIDRNMGLMTSLLQKLVHGNFSQNPEQHTMLASDRSNDEEDRHSVQSDGTEADVLSIGAPDEEVTQLLAQYQSHAKPDEAEPAQDTPNESPHDGLLQTIALDLAEVEPTGPKVNENLANIAICCGNLANWSSTPSWDCISRSMNCDNQQYILNDFIQYISTITLHNYKTNLTQKPLLFLSTWLYLYDLERKKYLTAYVNGRKYQCFFTGMKECSLPIHGRWLHLLRSKEELVSHQREMHTHFYNFSSFMVKDLFWFSIFSTYLLFL